MKTYTGIVLKHFAPYKHKVALLDRSLGHIIGILTHERLSVGTVLSYTIQVSQGRYFIKDVELVEMPLRLASQDMLFLHHILELCHYFIPEGVHAERVYDLLIFIFNRAMITNKQKKIFLCLLYVLLGLYAHDEFFYNSYMYELEQQPLHDMIDKDIDINIEKNISRWLYQCISMHIDVQKLKTVHFLDEI
jgi:hypothetical protein